MDMKKILVVDDEDDCVTFLEVILNDEGLNVVTANDGLEALQKVKDEKPDLILLDVQMPKMDGFSVFDKLRKDVETSKIPVVMLTGIQEKTGIDFSIKDMDKFYGSTPEGYIEKPIDPAKVIYAVRRILKL